MKKRSKQPSKGQIAIQPYAAAARIRKEFSKRYCMHPRQSNAECSSQLIKAHSVSRSTSLLTIAETGHVMRFDASIETLMKTNGRIKAQKVGVNEASTFTGFCHGHDSSTFALIDQPITTLSDRQVFLLAYRALCRELFTKTAAREVNVLGKELEEAQDKTARKLVHDFIHYREIGLELGLRDLRRHKAEYDKALLQQNSSGISWYVIELDHSVEIMCTVGFSPEVDFHGNRLQSLDLSTTHVDLLTCSIIKTTRGSAIVLAWLSEKNGACSRLVNSLDQIKTHLLPSAIVRLVFEHGENVFFSPTWWNSLDETERAKIEERANSFHDKPEGCLKDDGSRPVLWSVVGRVKQSSP